MDGSGTPQTAKTSRSASVQKRARQVVLIGSCVYLSWLGMMIVHEFGHVLIAWHTGGTVNHVLLHPFKVSQTDVWPNPHPLLEVWAGPVVGSLLPLIMLLIARVCRIPGLYLLRFFAGFCLVANGIYIGEGAFYRIADAGELLEYGASRWHLIVFGLLTVPAGLYLWHGLGPKFGLGTAHGEVNRTAALVTVTLLVLVMAAELAFHYAYKK